MMMGQPFELACREGSLLVSESRVMWRGNGAWALWRSQIASIGCACAAASDEAIVYLHLRDGRRFVVEDIAPRECFRLFELLDFAPQPEVSARQDNAPLAIDFGDGHTRLAGGAQSVALEQDHNPLWTVPRDQLLGIRVSAGTTATTVQIVTRGGGATLLENVPFATALRLLVALGAAPVEVEAMIATATAPAAETNIAEPPQATRATKAPKAVSSQTSKALPSRSTAHKEPVPTSPTAKGRRHATPVRPGPAETTIRPTQPSGHKRASPAAVPATPPPKQHSKPSGGPSTSPTQRVAVSNPSPKVAPPAAPVSLPPPPSPAPAAAFQAERQPAEDEAREGEGARGLYAQRLETPGTSPNTSVSEHAGSDAITVPQAALLQWCAALAAGALRLAGARAMIASASRSLGALRVPAGMRPRVGAPAAAGGVPHARMMSPRPAAWPRAWRLSRAHTDPRAFASLLVTRWRQIVLAVALGVAALMVAGDALVANAMPIAYPDAPVHGQMADLPPSQAAMPSTVRAGTITAGSYDRAIYTLEVRAGAIRWHDANP